MTDVTKELVDRLEQLSTDNHMPLERRLIDTVVWYHKNKKRIPPHDIQKRMDFMEKMFDIQLELTAMMVERAQHAEGRRKSESLWLPAGMRVVGNFGDTTDFG